MRATCGVRGCTEYVVGRGLCRKHYMRQRRKGSTDDRRENARGECSERGCHKPHRAKGLCDSHYVARWAHDRRAIARAEAPERSCGNCGESFTPLRYKQTGRAVFCSQRCKQVMRVASGRAAVDSRKSYFKRRYGLTIEQVEEMAAKGCGICGTTDWPGRHNRPHIDHDHTTGRVRGMLCSECNTGLGKFKDDPILVASALRYLDA